MPKIQFYPTDLTYKIADNKPEILIFGRAVDGKTICIIDDSFQPYFYIILKKNSDKDKFIEDISRISTKEKELLHSVLDVETLKKNFLGKEVEVLKVILNQPKAVPKIRELIKEREEIKEILEADILFTRRYLVDKGITPFTLCEAEGEEVDEKVKSDYIIRAEKLSQVSTDSLEEPKILAFDIETYNPMGKNVIPDKHPIIMLSLYSKEIKKVITWKKFDSKLKYVEFVRNEAELILRFKEIIEEYPPDIITGYFSDGFDLPYIKKRAEVNNVRLDLGMDNSNLKLTRGVPGSAKITGLIHLDVLKFVKNIMRGSLETDSYTLDNVSEEILGEKKKDVDLDILSEIWDKGSKELEKYCEYNLQDSILTFKLCERILPNIVEFVKIVGLTMYDIIRMGFSQLVEWYLIRQTRVFNELAPNKPVHDEIRKRQMQTFKGAFVYEPKPGLYEDIAVFDFRSLYPTIIASHNISPGTLNAECAEEEKDRAPGEKYWFCKGKKGFIPKVIEDLITRRMRINEILKTKKDKLLSARSYSLKILANAFYGYFGFFAARWYSIECAKSVTAWGRHYIQKVIADAKKSEFEVLYSDTDSIFLTLKGKTRNDAKKFVEKINLELPSLMELELEDFYPRGIFVSAKIAEYGAKKRYALISEKGFIKIRGFEAVRRNVSFIAKEVQEKVFSIILKEKDIPKAVKYVQEVVNDLKENKIPLDKVVIYTQIQKELSEYEQIGPHVAAAKLMIKKGIPIAPGSLIKYAIIKGKGMIRDRAKLPEDVKQKDYDPDYYIKHQVIPAVEKIFEVLGYKKEYLMQRKDQSKLQKFFK